MIKHDYIKDKNFLLIFFGDLISGIGSKVYTFGIALFLLDLTGKASSFALYISIFYLVVFILGPIAATFTDRYANKAKILYLSDFARGFLYILSGMLIWIFVNKGNTGMTLATVYTMLVFIGIFTSFFIPSIKATIPLIVKKEELVSASSVMQITGSIKNIAGLFLGAILYLKFGIVVLAIINGVTFLVSGISELFIKIKIKKDKIPEKPIIKAKFIKTIKDDLKESVNYLFSSGKPILTISPWFTVGVPFMFKEYFFFSNFKPEYLLASSQFIESCGIIIASIIIARIAARLKIYKILKFVSIFLIAFGAIYLAFIRAFDMSVITENKFIFGFLALNLILGLITACVNAPVEATIQKYVQHDKLGKVSMMITGFSGILYPITAMITGILLDNYGIYASLYVSIIAFVLIFIVVFGSKNLKKLI